MSTIELARPDEGVSVLDRHPRITVMRDAVDLYELPNWTAPDETFHFLLPLQGDLIVRFEQPLELGPQHGVLLEPGQLRHARVGDSSAVVALSFPSSAVGVPSARLRDAAARVIDASQGVAAIFVSLLRSLSTDAISPSHLQVALHLSDAVTALLSATLISADPSDAGGVARGEAVLLAARRWIEENLHDPNLSIAGIAAAQHISVSYLQKLFAADGHSVTGWIRERRCERCRRDLADPAQQSTAIAQIAERWGFTSAAHFSRLFKRSFGLSPRDYRTAALRRQVATGAPGDQE